MLIFEIWLSIFTEKKNSASSKFFKPILFILQNFMILAQNLHFFWYPQMKVADWNSYSKFWESLSMVSLDFLAVKYKLIQHFLFAEITVISLILASLIIIGFLKIQGKKVHSLYYSIVKVMIVFLCEFCFIPANILFLLVIKYSNHGPSFIEEYPNQLNKNYLDYGTGGILFSVFFLFTILILTVFFEASSYEIWQNQKLNPSDRKVQPNINMLSKCIYFINCCLYVIIQQNYYQTLLIITATLNALVSFFFIYHIPYYSFFLNFLKAFIHGNLALIGFFFFLGLKIDNCTVVFVLSLLIQAPWGKMLYEGLRYRISCIEFSEKCISNNIVFFELSIRSILASGEKGEELIKIMSKNLNLNYSKRNCVLQAYYCIDVLNNPSLGLNKIATVNHWGFDILENFQVYKCKQYALNICKHVSEVLKLYNFFVDFQEAKHLDIKFCKQYSKFLSQILHKSPPLLKMKQFVKKLIHNMDLIRFSYESLIQNFPNSLEVKDCYGSFALHILGDIESGLNNLNKSSDRETYITKNASKNSFSFVSSRCFFVVSGSSKINHIKKKKKNSAPKSKNYLGKILYYSKSFLSLLSFNEQSIKGIYLDHLLPVYLRKLHKGYMQKFMKSCVSQTVFDCHPLCLLDSNGFLIECYISTECIGVEGSLHFVCSVDPVENCRREFAVVDESGLIFAHSRGFTTLTKYENNHVEGHFINEFLDVCVEDLYDDKIINIIPNYEMDLSKNQIFVMKKVVSIGKSALVSIYISEEKESLIMRQNVQQNHTETDKIKKKIKEKKIRSIIEEEKQEKDVKKVEIYSLKSNFDDSDKDFETNLRSKQSSHSTSITFLSSKETQSLKKSIRALSIAKLVLLSSIIVMIASNITIVAYISKEVSHSNSLTAFTNLSNLAYALSQTSLILRAIDLNYLTGTFNVFTLQNATDNITLLKKYQNLLLSDYDTWSYCPSSNIINENVISYWDFESEPVLKYGSLTSIVGTIITKAQEIIIQIENGDNNYKKNFFFIIFNCLGSTFEQANNAINELAKCEHDRVEELTLTKNYLLISGVGVTSCALLFIAVYLMSIDKHLNSLWQYLRKRVKNGYCEVKNMISDRLCNYHSEFDVHNKEDDEVREQFELNYKHSFYYLARFSVIFGLGAVFYIVSALVFFEHIHVNLLNRPILVSTLIQRRIQLTELCIYSLENELSNTENSLLNKFPIFDSFIPISYAVSNVVNNVILTRKKLTANDIKKLMSSDLYGYLFEYVPDASYFLNFGTFRSLAFLLQESYFITFNNVQDSQETLIIFFQQANEFNKVTEITTDLASNSSKKIIEEQLNNLIYFISASCLLLVIIYWGYIYPYLCSEIRVVKNITKILLILPNSSEEVPTRDKKPMLNGS